MLGLQGDSVDNIPGVPGVGPKTAAKLIREFGSVESLIENTDKLKGKLKENVEYYKDQALLSKELARIKIDAPIAFDPKGLEYEGKDDTKLKEIFKELEFRTIAKRMFGEDGDGQQMSMFQDVEITVEDSLSESETIIKTVFNTRHIYHLIEEQEYVDSLIEHLQLQKEFCFDTETTGIYPFEAEIVGLSFSYIPGEAYYIPVPKTFDLAREFLEQFKAVLKRLQALLLARIHVLIDRQIDPNFKGFLLE